MHETRASLCHIRQEAMYQPQGKRERLKTVLAGNRSQLSVEPVKAYRAAPGPQYWIAVRRAETHSNPVAATIRPAGIELEGSDVLAHKA